MRILYGLCASLAMAPAAEAMTCVQITPPPKLLLRCLGNPAVTHPFNYWQGFGMIIVPAPGFEPYEPVTRARCAAGAYAKRYLIWQSFIETDKHTAGFGGQITGGAGHVHTDDCRSIITAMPQDFYRVLLSRCPS